MSTAKKTLFVCAKCDAQSPKWNGRCGECGAFGTLEAASLHAQQHGPTAASTKKAASVTAFGDIADSGTVRMPTGFREVDRVLGGGIVEGSVTLLGGEPGIGKSTLALMLAGAVAASGRPVLYVSGEESAEQVKGRASRLTVRTQGVGFIGETDVDAVISAIAKERPFLTVIDSIQTLWSDDVPSEAGAVGQMRLVAGRLTAFAKANRAAIVIIGHVNKDGQVAGPKTLEHLVDTVLSFEGERFGQLRVLRTLKNRFGTTDECGLFAMEEQGLIEIANPSAFLLDERRPGIPGSVIFCALEGTRPMLVEIQALTQKTSFGYPTRRTSGFDQSRLEMLIAVLSRRANVDLSQHDVFVNVVGGMKIKEPAADLAVALALASASGGIPVPEKLAAWGEVGLGGEIRAASGAEKRAAECANLGMTAAVCPASSAKKMAKAKTLALHAADTLAAALSQTLKK